MFVRQDIPIQQQIVQSNHAVLSLAQWRGVDGIPNLVVIGVPNQKALARVKAKLEAAAIAHFAWEEPDMDLGFTALATEPLAGEKRTILAHYRLWNPFISAGSSVKGSKLQSGHAYVPIMPEALSNLGAS